MPNRAIHLSQRGRRSAWRRRRAEPGHPTLNDAAAEAPGGAGVPNRAIHRLNDAAAEAPGGAGVPNRAIQL